MKKRGRKSFLLVLAIAIFTILSANIVSAGWGFCWTFWDCDDDDDDPEDYIGCYYCGASTDLDQHTHHGAGSMACSNFGLYFTATTQPNPPCTENDYTKGSIYNPDKLKAACDCIKDSVWDESVGCCGDDSLNCKDPLQADDPDKSELFCTECKLGENQGSRIWDKTLKQCCGDDTLDGLTPYAEDDPDKSETFCTSCPLGSGSGTRVWDPDLKTCCGDDTVDGTKPYEQDDPDHSELFCTTCSVSNTGVGPESRDWHNSLKCCGDDVEDCGSVTKDYFCYDDGGIWSWLSAKKHRGKVYSNECGEESVLSTGTRWLVCSDSTFSTREKSGGHFRDPAPVPISAPVPPQKERGICTKSCGTSGPGSASDGTTSSSSGGGPGPAPGDSGDSSSDSGEGVDSDVDGAIE